MMEWLFEGLGTALITFALGALVGGGAGYFIGVKSEKNKQIQRGKNNVRQTQIGKVVKTK